MGQTRGDDVENSLKDKAKRNLEERLPAGAKRTPEAAIASSQYPPMSENYVPISLLLHAACDLV